LVFRHANTYYFEVKNVANGKLYSEVQGKHKVFPDYIHLLQENMLELHIALQLEEFQQWIIFQQDGAPQHWGSHVRRFLDTTFPNRWIGRDGPTP